MQGSIGTARLGSVIQKRSFRVAESLFTSPVLGEVVGSDVMLDNLDIPIPLDDFEMYEPEVTLTNASGEQQDYTVKLRLKSKDRILVIPTGDSFLIMGHVK